MAEIQSNLRLSHQTLRVLKVFLDAFSEDVRAELAGADLMQAARVSSGTLYPILVRLERAGVLASRWEEERPEALGRPRRRFYRITPAGLELARNALADLAPTTGILNPGQA
jgi:DNA-binding PadR family transcriptional regulator